MIHWVRDRSVIGPGLRRWFLVNDGAVIGFMTAEAIYFAEYAIVNDGDLTDETFSFSHWQASFGTTLSDDRTYPRLRDVRQWREEILRWVPAMLANDPDLSFDDDARRRPWEQQAPRSLGALRRRWKRLRKQLGPFRVAREPDPDPGDEQDWLPF